MQAIAAKGDKNDADLSKMTSNINYGTSEDVEKFNARSGAVKDTCKK